MKAGVQHPLEVLLVLYSRKLLYRLYPHQILHVQRYSNQGNYCTDCILIRSYMYKGTVLKETIVQIVSSSDPTCTKVQYSRKLLYRLHPHQILHVQRYSTQENYCTDCILVRSYKYKGAVLKETIVQIVSSSDPTCTKVQHSRKLLYRLYPHQILHVQRYSIQGNYCTDSILIRSYMYKATVLNETGVQIVSSSDPTCTKVQHSRKLLYRSYPQ